MSQRGVLRIIEGDRLGFFCPGCECAHVVTVAPHPAAVWGFNGNYDSPTFTPSVLIRSGHYVPGHDGEACWCTYYRDHPATPTRFKCEVCHSFVTDGKIQFLGDCTHALAGQVVPLEPPLKISI